MSAFPNAKRKHGGLPLKQAKGQVAVPVLPQGIFFRNVLHGNAPTFFFNLMLWDALTEQWTETVIADGWTVRLWIAATGDITLFDIGVDYTSPTAGPFSQETDDEPAYRLPGIADKFFLTYSFTQTDPDAEAGNITITIPGGLLPP